MTTREKKEKDIQFTCSREVDLFARNEDCLKERADLKKLRSCFQIPSQSTIHISSSAPSPLQYYLLLFVDDNEHVIVPEGQIREFVKGQAVVFIGRQRRIGRVEAQSQYEIFSQHH